MNSSTIIASLQHTITTHTSDINGVAFSGAHTLATCSGDKTVRLWDVDDFSELPCSPLCGHSYYVHNCTFSPFGTLLATCSTDGKLILWEVKSGNKTATMQHPSKSPIRMCRFSPNSMYIVTASDDETLCLWEVSGKKLIRSLPGHEAGIVACAFSPDSNFIISGSSLGDINVWDAKFGHSKPLAHLPDCHDLGVTGCDFSPTYGSAGSNNPGTVVSQFMLVTCGNDDLVKLWDFMAEVGTTAIHMSCRKSMAGHTSTVMACCFSADGRIVASGSQDKTIRLWDPVDGVCIHVIEGHSRYVTCCAFSFDGQYLASGSNDRTVMIWKILTGDAVISELEKDGGLQESADNELEVLPKSKKALANWSIDDVCTWVTEIGLGQYTSHFRRHAIDGTELKGLKDKNLQELGIEALGHRNKILRARTQIPEHPVLERKHSSNQHSDAGVADEYLCPITREVMKDPVIASDGYTYERVAITAWMEKKKDRSPMTNAVLPNKVLTPNRSLKMLIQRHLQR